LLPPAEERKKKEKKRGEEEEYNEKMNRQRETDPIYSDGDGRSAIDHWFLLDSCPTVSLSSFFTGGKKEGRGKKGKKRKGGGRAKE